MKKILLTGAAGFIGYHIAKELLDNNYTVIGIDNLNDYYDISLKEARINNIIDNPHFTFIKEDINNTSEINAIFKQYQPEIVVHLAAYAGVRYSLEQPDIYIKNNVDGFYNILKIACDNQVKHFVFSSSSSIYGNIDDKPSKEEDATINQESLYACTKMCDEVIAKCFAKLYETNITAVRPFTVYGPFGRPDMAYFNFTNKLLNNEPITVYDHGNLRRNYTYISDVVNGLFQIINNEPKAKFNVYNIGGADQYTINELIAVLKTELINNNLVDQSFDFDHLIQYSDIKKGEVNSTYADNTKINHDFGYNPQVSLEVGIKEFIQWYKDYYHK